MRESQSQSPLDALKFFRVNDWVFVAAASLEEAIAWHRKEFRDDEIELADTYEVPGTGLVSMEERPDSPKKTMREIADAYLAEGKKPPFEICYDSHYI